MKEENCQKQVRSIFYTTIAPVRETPPQGSHFNLKSQLAQMSSTSRQAVWANALEPVDGAGTPGLPCLTGFGAGRSCARHWLP